MTTPTPTTKKKREQKVKTREDHILVILDESGSMSPVASDVRGGFNANYIGKLKEDGNTYRVTVLKFGSTVCPLVSNVPLDAVPELNVENYMPLASTALYDALGYAFEEAKKTWGTVKKPYGEHPVKCIIITDGLENASKKYTKEEIVREIKSREESGNWTFVYLMADQNAWAVAQSLGLAQGNVLSYASASTNTMFGNLATSTTVSSGTSAPTQTRRFFDPNGGSHHS